jgi:hypothetical protein
MEGCVISEIINTNLVNIHKFILDFFGTCKFIFFKVDYGITITRGVVSLNMLSSRVIVQPEDAAYLCFVRKEQLSANNSSMAGGPRSFDHSPSYTPSHPSLSGRQHMGQAKGRRRCPLPVRQAWHQLRAKPAIPRGFDHRFSTGDVYLPTYHLRRRRPSLKLGILTAAVMWNSELPEQQKRNQSITLQSPSTSRSPNLPPPSWLAL